MKRIMIEIDKCDGCKNCSAACMQAHREDEGDIYTLDLRDIKNESRNYILKDGAGRYVPIFCRHCEEPDCVMSCMSGALTKDAVTGLVLYDKEKCGTCFMCVMNCSFGVLKPDRAERNKVIKCDFCKDDELGPNCVRMCPKKAIRVEEVKAQ
ncbi:MAG: 4Fe-4S dicluster domain-containing protein [Oscillospiraceae bacterium]|nr:4Fe-4S dicluster domain-containing protein [Oscillospiraceae bacterium]